MSAKYTYTPKSKCGYNFREQRARQLGESHMPIPYSRVINSGEEIVLTDEEVIAWCKAYRRATKELGVKSTSEDEAVYKRVDEILRETGNYRFV